jgi:tetratricopeptide (TPR) repeat protein
MRHQQSSFGKCRDSLILLIILALPTVSIAEPYGLQLAVVEVPGTEGYAAGNLDAAIELLEGRESIADDHYAGLEMATLCALYILKVNLDAARETCSAAVKIDQSGYAYINRGVLRAQLGDTVGALEDFDRVRVLPDDQPRYIEQSKENNARFIASRNFAVTSEIMERRRANEPTMSGVVNGANIEEINH